MVCDTYYLQNYILDNLRTTDATYSQRSYSPVEVCKFKVRVKTIKCYTKARKRKETAKGRLLNKSKIMQGKKTRNGSKKTRST